MRWLIVSSEPDLRLYLRDCLESIVPRVEVLEAADGFEALAQIGGGGVELVIADLDQPRMNGLELARFLARQPLPVLLLSAELDRGDAAAAGAAGVLSMPFTRRELGRRVMELTSLGTASPAADASRLPLAVVRGGQRVSRRLASSRARPQ